MPAIQVAKLKLHCSTQQVGRMRFAIEDGLHTAIPDDPRLVMVRRMQVPGEVGTVHPARRQDAFRTGWLAAISTARHGSDDGAAEANCVWFASREEAETALLARLLAGREVEAWYWRLALPDWRGRPPRNWASVLLADAVAKRRDRRVLAIARCFIAAGAVDQLVEVINGLSEARSETGPGPPVAAGPRLPSPARQHAFEEIANTAAAVLAQSTGQELGGVIARLARTGGDARAVAGTIVHALMLKRSPALALSPGLAAAAVAAAVDGLVEPQPGPRLPKTKVKAKIHQRRPFPEARAEGLVPNHDLPPAERVDRREVPRRDAACERMDFSVEPPADSAAPEATQSVQRRLHSAHAGVWLVVPSLITLGFREWLADRPALLGDGPGGQLLRGIAAHHRVALDDPALVAIFPTIDPDVRPEWCQLWRHGLDRWLRRTAGRRLHDLANRPGEFTFGDQSLIIHYPAADADLALRRRALDRDPGWTDWLGLSIRYRFGGTENWL